jgi:hypothetical protein
MHSQDSNLGVSINPSRTLSLDIVFPFPYANTETQGLEGHLTFRGKSLNMSENSFPSISASNRLDDSRDSLKIPASKSASRVRCVRFKRDEPRKVNLLRIYRV